MILIIWILRNLYRTAFVVVFAIGAWVTLILGIPAYLCRFKSPIGIFVNTMMAIDEKTVLFLNYLKINPMHFVKRLISFLLVFVSIAELLSFSAAMTGVLFGPIHLTIVAGPISVWCMFLLGIIITLRIGILIYDNLKRPAL